MKMYLHKIRIDSQGYDRNGYYFGVGQPLYHYENVDDPDISGYVRGTTRDAAKQAVAAVIAKAINPDAKLMFFGSLVAAVIGAFVSCPTGAVAATIELSPVPMCYFVVATDAPNPQAIFIHEQAHCWGWTHPVHDGKRPVGYKASMPHGKWLKPYPRKRLVVQFETMANVPAICGDANEPYGCQWGGLQK